MDKLTEEGNLLLRDIVKDFGLLLEALYGRKIGFGIVIFDMNPEINLNSYFGNIERPFLAKAFSSVSKFIYSEIDIPTIGTC